MASQEFYKNFQLSKRSPLRQMPCSGNTENSLGRCISGVKSLGMLFSDFREQENLNPDIIHTGFTQDLHGPHRNDDPPLLSSSEPTSSDPSRTVPAPTKKRGSLPSRGSWSGYTTAATR